MSRPLLKTHSVMVRLSDGEHSRLMELSGGAPLGPWLAARALGEVPLVSGTAIVEAARRPVGTVHRLPGESARDALRRCLEEFDDGPAVAMRRERDPMMKSVDACIAALRQAIARLS